MLNEGLLEFAKACPDVLCIVLYGRGFHESWNEVLFVQFKPLLNPSLIVIECSLDKTSCFEKNGSKRALFVPESSKKSYFFQVNFATLARFLLNNHNRIEK